MAKVTLILDDEPGGVVRYHYESDPELPDKPEEQTPAQRLLGAMLSSVAQLIPDEETPKGELN